MTQIPILSGIYTDTNYDFRTSYPLNMEPIPKVTGISQGYLRPSDGILSEGTGPGIARGGINWNGVCYRVMGTKLVTVDAAGTVTTIGDVGGAGPVSMTYGFDYLAIASGGDLWLYDGVTLAQNVDQDLGTALDVVWIDGYFATTDGENIVVTELGNPFSVNPLKYGSSEVDADDVVAVERLGSELYAVNRYTTEAFTNVGGQFFPFQVIEGAQIFKGAVGTHAVTQFAGALAMVGSGRNEAPAVYMVAGGAAARISTREIEQALADVSSENLANVVCETRTFDGRNVLYIHLPTVTLAYDAAASQAIGQPAWWRLGSALDGDGPYRARYYVYAHDKWMVADTDSAAVGRLADTVSSHWGDVTAWEIVTPIIYGGGKGVELNDLQLVGMPGSVAVGATAQVGLSHSNNGITWTSPRYRSLGPTADRTRPVRWTRLGQFRNWRILRLTGDSHARLPIAALEAQMANLAW